MNYLAYYEVLEGGWFKISNDLQSLKDEWFFTIRIWEIPDTLTMEEFSTWEKPRFPKASSIFQRIYFEGELMHEKETYTDKDLINDTF